MLIESRAVFWHNVSKLGGKALDSTPKIFLLYKDSLGKSRFESWKIMSTNNIFLDIFRKILAGTVDLPSLPDAALKIRAAIQNPNNDIAAIAKIVQMDPPLTAHLIQVANSPLYRTANNATDVAMAISRFGLEATRNIAVSFSLKSLFKSNSKILQKLLKRLWLESTQTAAISSVLASQCKGFDPDRAMLAGLLQDIGTLPVLAELNKHPELLVDTNQTEVILLEYSPKVGAMLLKHWNFEDDIVEVAASKNQWNRQPNKDADLADLILIARYHAYIGKPFFKNCPKVSEIPAFEKLGFDSLTPESSLTILEDAKKDIIEIQSMLNV